MMSGQMKTVLLFCALWAAFQVAFSSGKYFQNKSDVNLYIGSVEKRIALDLPKLKLANPLFKTVNHPASVREYLEQINSHLSEISAPVRIQSLHGVTLEQTLSDTLVERELQTTEQTIKLTIAELENKTLAQGTVFAPIFAIVFVFLCRRHLASREQAEPDAALAEVEKPTLRLVINLHNKTISNGVDSLSVSLSNKPFCFYAALVDYCTEHESPILNHNKEVPEEILHLANKYFYRLIELGHTKRKRPDFGTNLDKTLSEIRSALDEVFHDYIEEKDKFSPPKAQGEGSRSKIHNYAIEHLNPDQVLFIGK